MVRSSLDHTAAAGATRGRVGDWVATSAAAGAGTDVACMACQTALVASASAAEASTSFSIEFLRMLMPPDEEFI
ncbi:hypothetical protein CsSME_00005030 [Camellia sinensis var. sinensis]